MKMSVVVSGVSHENERRREWCESWKLMDVPIFVFLLVHSSYDLQNLQELLFCDDVIDLIKIFSLEREKSRRLTRFRI